MECLAGRYHAVVFRIVRAIASFTPCLTQLSSHMKKKYDDPPRTGHPAADQIAASLTTYWAPKKMPQYQLASKLEVDYEIWMRSGVLDWLDKETFPHVNGSRWTEPSSGAEGFSSRQKS